MQLPSLSLILSGIFIAYIAHSIWTLAQLFIPPTCGARETCITSYLHNKPKLQLLIYTSAKFQPSGKDVTLMHNEIDFNYNLPKEIQLNDVSIPQLTRQNGSLYLHLFLQQKRRQEWEFSELKRAEHTTYTKIKLTQYHLPEAATFQLLGSVKNINKEKVVGRTRVHPVTHLKSRVTFNIMTDDISMPKGQIPMEVFRLITITSKMEFLPIVQYDFLNNRLRDLVHVTNNFTEANITLFYTPTSIGKLRLVQHIETALRTLLTVGFTEKDVDEVKGIFADTNLYLLCITIFISAIHLLFDFLAFKHDVSFWRQKQNLVGLSSRTIVWRAFSQIVVFLYLMDENTSLLILVPTGIATIIELWKAQKLVRIQFYLAGNVVPWVKLTSKGSTEAEQQTQKFDAESMRYLSYLLYPLCCVGAIYSLLYEPHKGWYSWSVHSLVNGVYAFGFLFMLPQLFVNYRLKSVAHLPWRAFMYKAFNTFIDDVFAFIITMPTAHRVACFRDDIVFLIYLYQRWLYPVDKSRLDESARIIQQNEDKKND